jgi:hypothetical protein
VQITAQGFTSDAPATRASDSGYTTTFAAGDCIGIFAVANGEVQDDNVPYTYNGTAWEPVDPANPACYYPGATYLAYYPHDPAMTGKTSPEEILAAFAAFATVTPPTDQSTPAAYTASDLMTGSGTPSGATLAITLAHALSLLEVNLPSAATDVKLRVNSVEVTPHASGTLRRLLVTPTTAPVTIEGSYRAGGCTMLFSKTTPFPAGRYTRLNIDLSRISGGYTGLMTVNYTNATSEDVTIPADGTFQLAESTGKTIRDITLNGHEHLIGRATDRLLLNVDADGNLHFRPADANGYIPIGSYAEFQLINTARGSKYKQEADLDLMNVGWSPVGSFGGTFDGGGHTLANLKINPSGSNNVGLFESVAAGGKLSNIAIVSGSVTGNGNYAGGVCASNSGTITACYNSSSVWGSIRASGICGVNNGTITACYNTGSVNSYYSTGGVCGVNNGTITACYNGRIAGSNGGVCGPNNGTITACYTVNTATSGETVFGPGAWPETTTHAEWGTDDGTGSGKYWKTLGYWSAVTPVYPRLWFEKTE